MNDRQWLQIYKHAKQWTIEAGERIRKMMNETIKVTTKNHKSDLVTNVDQAVELFFLKQLEKNYPEHQLMAEEGSGRRVASLDNIVWFIDPIDGTTNFVHKKRDFAISVGIYKEGIGYIGLIYDVMDDILYEAVKGKGAFKNGKSLRPLTHKTVALDQSMLHMSHAWLLEHTIFEHHHIKRLMTMVRSIRYIGAASLEIAYVAEGIIDGYLAIKLSSWDFAAGQIILNEVDGLLFNPVDPSLNILSNQPIVACHPDLRESLMNHLIVKKNDSRN